MGLNQNYDSYNWAVAELFTKLGIIISKRYAQEIYIHIHELSLVQKMPLLKLNITLWCTVQSSAWFLHDSQHYVKYH